MSLQERFGVGFGGGGGAWFSSGNRGRGEGGGEGGGVGWGQAKEPASQCARVCQNYPVAIYPLYCFSLNSQQVMQSTPLPLRSIMVSCIRLRKNKMMTMTKIPSQKTCYTYLGGHEGVFAEKGARLMGPRAPPPPPPHPPLRRRKRLGSVRAGGGGGRFSNASRGRGGIRGGGGGGGTQVP